MFYKPLVYVWKVFGSPILSIMFICCICRYHAQSLVTNRVTMCVRLFVTRWLRNRLFRTAPGPNHVGGDKANVGFEIFLDFRKNTPHPFFNVFKFFQYRQYVVLGVRKTFVSPQPSISNTYFFYQKPFS